MILHPDFLQNILGHFYKQVGPHAFLVMMVVAMCAVYRWQTCAGLDCDMIVHPDFLQNILGHFYKQVKTIGCRYNNCPFFESKVLQLVCVGAGLQHDRAPGLPADHPGPLLQAGDVQIVVMLYDGMIHQLPQAGAVVSHRSAQLLLWSCR
jgi:hypothetical protein